MPLVSESFVATYFETFVPVGQEVPGEIVCIDIESGN
jgi:hypothetical protein